MPSTHDLFGTVDVNVDGTTAPWATPVDQATAIDETGKEIIHASRMTSGHLTTLAAATKTYLPWNRSVLSPSRPDKVARKSPSHILARLSETLGENIFAMDNLSHDTTEIVETSEDSPSSSERVPVLAG